MACSLDQSEVGGVCSSQTECDDGRDGTSVCHIAPAVVRFMNTKEMKWQGIDVSIGRATAIQTVNCSNILIERLNISNMAVSAVIVSGGKNVTIRRAKIFDTGMGGVVLNGGDREKLTASHHVLEDSELFRTDRWKYTEVPAVDSQGVGSIVRHNWIHHKKHHAFRQGGNNHLIENNLVQ